ncbi:hypothetical protein [Christiangramia aquimixticola]|uniref:hypothetical protein n=1 Tax=Christiangramia aquimixticola TaxID=1697558 RepID=UPI003AA917F7
MKTTLSIILTVLTVTTLLGQNPTNSGNLADGFKIMRSESKGTPFLTEDWHVGYGILPDGKTTRPQQMNYDVHGNNLVYKIAGSDQVLKLLDNSLTGFIIKSKEKDLLFAKIGGEEFEKQKDETKYYQIVQAPSRAVLIEYVKELEDPNASGWTSSQSNTLASEYKMKTDYYVLNKNGKYEDVKLKNRSVLKVFKDKKKKIEAYLESNGLEIETPEDLLQVSEYYQTL